MSKSGKTVRYYEYNSTGEGANPKSRAKYSKQLKSPDFYSIEKVLAGTDGWNPAANGNALLSLKR